MLAAVRLALKRLITVLVVLGLAWSAWAPTPSLAAQVVGGVINPRDLDNSESSSFGRGAETTRRLAEERLGWVAPASSTAETLQVKILAINDFHGQIGTGKKVSSRPVGSAPVLAAYLKEAQKGWEDRTIIAEAGDLMGASPPDSALLQDEPSIMFMNLLGNSYCKIGRGLGGIKTNWHPLGNLVGVVGNHEFDKGYYELLRRLYGGNYAKGGPFLENPWKGADYPTLAANVISRTTKKPILPPSVIKRVMGMPTGFIGRC